jgi:L-ascorbate metabolism protein UlaG (beta-lactamase superfamily)
MSLTIQRLGGATAVLGYAGLRLLTDPTFDAPRDFDSAGVTLSKLAPPALGPDEVGDVDVVLLSHDHHPDNLDEAGRAFLPRARRVLTTVKGAERLGGGATGLEPWQSVELDAPSGRAVAVTAVPAQHGPDGSEPYTGPVIGFLLAAEGEPRVYVSGDNASLDVVRAIAERGGPIDVAVLFAGGASIPERFDGAPLTLTAADAAEAARLLGARAVVPVHVDGWRHFGDDEAATRAAFAAAGLEDRLVAPEHGAAVTV